MTETPPATPYDPRDPWNGSPRAPGTEKVDTPAAFDHFQTDLFANFFPGSTESEPATPTPGSARPPSVKPAISSRTPSAQSVSKPAASSQATQGMTIFPPSVPTTLEESGLTLMQVGDLILKQLYLQGCLLGVDMARNARLPFNIVDEVLRFLKDEKCLEVMSGEMIGRASYRFNLTELGRLRAREAFELCRYVGPAPVSLESYVQQCRRQTVKGISCNAESLAHAFSEIVLKKELLGLLGPAVCSGRSIFIYGPPGNGKSLVGKGLGRYLNLYGGEIYIPYALQSEGAIITLYDPTLHQATDDADLPPKPLNPQDGNAMETARLSYEPSVDMRWRKIRRPVIITGGELTLEMLDLRYIKTSNFYTAPLHIKANSGVFLIDDFGRQIVSPRDLLNRWILPLEERIDYLTLVTGKKFSVPFEQLIIFSTNLDPAELVDEAFLRRMRHKIMIGSPDRQFYTDIFQLCCEQRQIAYSPDVVDFIYRQYYDQGKTPKSSDPRDLLEIADSICRFNEQPLVLTPELVSEAAGRFFCKL
ncbi:MAG: ATPase [Planctomycetaceae bacterium]